MSESMQTEIDKAVDKFTPSKEVGGVFLSRDDFRTLARKAVTEGTFIGWCHAENMTRQRLQRKLDHLEYEISCLKDRLKEAELELLAASK